MKEDGDAGASASSSRRTRSQKAPDWTVSDCLVLVNVIASVEEDCLKALSTFQKWKIIAENCTSLDVFRTSNQCRRKWDSLLAEHDVIKQWEFKFQGDSYWCLESGRRKEMGLPDNFNKELFRAIDNLVALKENELDTEPDSDPEAEVEIPDEIAEPGPKKRRHRPTSKRNNTLEKSVECEAQEKTLLSTQEVDLCEVRIKSPDEKEMDFIELEEQMMAKQLLENSKRIHAIVSESAEYETSDVKNAEERRADFIRCQGDKLISCLGDILNTINDLSGLLEDCE